MFRTKNLNFTSFRLLGKKNVIVALKVTLILIVLFLLLYGYLSYASKAYTEESKIFVNKLVPSIFNVWSYKQIENSASHEFLTTTSEEELRDYFEFASEKLGKMQLYTGSQGEARVLLNLKGFLITADYYGVAEFEKGEAMIVTHLIKRGEEWQLTGFNIESDLLTQESTSDVERE